MPPPEDAVPLFDSDPGARPHLAAKLIGEPRIVWRTADADEPVVCTDKPFALLCWLALEGRPVLKHELAELFWGPGKRHNLRVALYTLRRLPGAEVWLESSGDAVRVTALSDAASLVAALDEDTGTGSDPERAVAIWRASAGGVRPGAALLAGAVAVHAPAFDETIENARRQWAERYRTALAAAAQALAARGDHAAALGRLDAALEIDSLDEALVRRAMALEDALGRRSAALERYERLRRELAAELEVQPAAATREAYDALCATERGRRAPPRSADPLAVLRGSRRTPFVARERDLARIEAAFETASARHGGRWVTLLGPGGVGKSRLALEYAARVGPHRAVAVVALERLTEPTAWPEAAAHALGLPLPGGVSAETQLHAALHEREALLVFDGLEAVRSVWQPLGQLVGATPRLRVLATSRVRLGLPSERVVMVEPLATETRDDAAGGPHASDAGRLLLAAAQRDDAAFEPSDRERRAMERIGRAVEGMPLGLELAAGWLRLYGAERLADRLEDDPLALDDPDRPDSGRDPASVIARSWELLTGAGRRTLASLTVFRGGFDAETALKVAGETDARVLLELVDSSLLLRDGAGRFDLHAGVRHWVSTHADPTWVTVASERHARLYVGELLPAAAAVASGKDPERLDRGRLESEHHNVMTAWAWACERSDVDLIGAALDPMALYLRVTEHNEEGLDAMARAIAAIERVHGAVTFVARARVHRAWFANITGRYLEAVGAVEPALAAVEADRRLAAEARRNLGYALANLERFDESVRQLHAAADLYTRTGDRLDLARTCNYLGINAFRRGDLGKAGEHYRACLEHARTAGSELGIASALANLGEIALAEVRLAEAESLLEEALARFVASGYRAGEAAVTLGLGLLDWRRGAREAGQARMQESLAEYRALGRVREQAEVHAELARVGGGEGRRHAETALALARRLGQRATEAVALARLAVIDVRDGRPEAHREGLAAARRLAGSSGAPWVREALREAEEAARGNTGSGSSAEPA